MSDARHYGSPFDYKPESWMNDAACIGHDPEMWFAELGGQNGSASSEMAAQAKAICGGCPSRLACLDYSMSTEPGWLKFGIWGGLTPDARRRLAKEAS